MMPATKPPSILSSLPLYRLLRPLLFRLDPETGHGLAFRFLNTLHKIPGLQPLAARRRERLPVRIMGIDLANPVGLAAGFDKNAECVDPFAALGFGFLELGTVTPRPQTGNPRPRLFRLADARALINRMGFNNVGLEVFLSNLARWEKPCPIGINIGKNKDTPTERALDDYVLGLRAVYPFADYVTINISSPNTPGLRALQQSEALNSLLGGLESERATLTAKHGRRVPLAVKISPDLDDAQITEIARTLLRHRIDAVIATNTTLSRSGVGTQLNADETGGLSGAPLKNLSTAVILRLHRSLNGRIPIIGVGGIETADDAWEKLVAGADAVQIYTALIYHGPGLVQKIVHGLAVKVADAGATTLAEALSAMRRASDS